MIAVKRIGWVGIAALALVVALGVSPARAEDKPQVVYPDPVEVIYSVGAIDGAVSTAKQKNATVTTLSGDVNFEVDSDQLTARAKEILDSLAADWSKAKPSTVTVTGYTDSVADDAYNQTLSERRAKAVADYLTSKVASLNVQSSGKGESEPVASETNEDGSVNEAGKAANRHVDVRWG